MDSILPTSIRRSGAMRNNEMSEETATAPVPPPLMARIRSLLGGAKVPEAKIEAILNQIENATKGMLIVPSAEIDALVDELTGVLSHVHKTTPHGKTSWTLALAIAYDYSIGLCESEERAEVEGYA